MQNQQLRIRAARHVVAFLAHVRGARQHRVPQLRATQGGQRPRHVVSTRGVPIEGQVEGAPAARGCLGLVEPAQRHEAHADRARARATEIHQPRRVGALVVGARHERAARIADPHVHVARRVEHVTLDHPRIHGQAVQPLVDALGPLRVRVAALGNLPVREHLERAAGGHAIRSAAQDCGNQVVAIHATVTILVHARRAAHGIWRDHEGRIRDDQVEGLTFNRLEQGAFAHVNRRPVKGGVELGERARTRRQVGRDDAARVRGQVESLDAAAAAHIQGRVDLIAHGHLQQRPGRPADAHHVVISQRLAGLSLPQVRGHPPLALAARQGRRVRTQIVQGAHPRVHHDLGLGFLVGIAHRRQGGCRRERGLLPFARLRALTLGRGLGARAGHDESGGGFVLVDGGCEAEGLQAGRAQRRQGRVQGRGTLGLSADKKTCQGRCGGVDAREFDQCG